jgi:hypothetical protein
MADSGTKLESMRATVTKVVGDGNKRYCVTMLVDDGRTVTFSLVKKVWDQAFEPVVGEEVELSRVYKTKNGFRASFARRIVA